MSDLCRPSREPEIPKALMMLEDRISDLSSELESFKCRIESILQFPMPENTSEKCDKPRRECPLSDRIFNCIDKINEMRDFLEKTTARLEI